MGDRDDGDANGRGGGGRGGGGEGGGLSNNTFRRFTQLPDYAEDKQAFVRFLQNFAQGVKPSGDPIKPYYEVLVEVANRRTEIVNVKLSDVLAFEGDQTMVRNLTHNTLRYREIVADAADEVLQHIRAHTDVHFEEDVIDVLMHQRQQQQEEARTNNPDGPALHLSDASSFPPQLMRRFDVNFVPDMQQQIGGGEGKQGLVGRAVREVTANDIGHLVTMTVMVTRVTDVKPLVTVATYTCDVCGFEIYQEIKSRSFLPLTECHSASCVENGKPGKLFLQTRGSKFSKFQTAKVQEIPTQVPVGHIPRSMNVYIRGVLTRRLLPGNVVTLSGVFLPIRWVRGSVFKGIVHTQQYCSTEWKKRVLTGSEGTRPRIK